MLLFPKYKFLTWILSADGCVEGGNAWSATSSSGSKTYNKQEASNDDSIVMTPSKAPVLIGISYKCNFHYGFLKSS